MPQNKYARVERERRFLLAQFPSGSNVVSKRGITDYYIEGTTLRLRQEISANGPATFKLTQKLQSRGDGAQQGWVTSMYLRQDEFHLLARLPSRKLVKTRFSVPPFGIDVFADSLEGLVMAEAEFDSAAAAETLTIPFCVAGEVSQDDRFTGSQLARASRLDLQHWLLDYGIALVL
jgi:CYTH domain-containing protein